MSDLLDRLEGINTRNATASTHARKADELEHINNGVQP